MIPRTKRKASRVNLIVSVVFHTLAIGALFFFAAREGMLGKKLKQLTVVMVPKEKKPEPPKEKPPEPKIEPPKPETPKPTVAVAPPKPEPVEAPPPAVAAGPVSAPAPASLASFDFSDGAKEVVTGSGPGGVYKGMVEHALLAHWNRPEDIDDEKFAAEVKLTVDPSGAITSYEWVTGSGNARWDKSVKDVVARTKKLNTTPPKGFPSTFNVRFDVQSLKTEPLQLSIQ